MLYKCKRLRSIANKRKTECEDGHYHGLAVDIMLLQLQIIQLQIRPSVQVSSGLQQCQRQDGFGILSECQLYFEKYDFCRKYQTAANRALEMLSDPSGPFYESVSVAERKSALEGMQAEPYATENWNCCCNGHLVNVSVMRYTGF